MNPKIMKYVPKSKVEAIEDAWIDSDGMWITLTKEDIMNRQKEQDWEQMIRVFVREFHAGCDTLKKQRNQSHSFRSLMKYCDWYDLQTMRMLEERYGREEQ